MAGKNLRTASVSKADEQSKAVAAVTPTTAPVDEKAHEAAVAALEASLPVQPKEPPKSKQMSHGEVQSKDNPPADKLPDGWQYVWHDAFTYKGAGGKDVTVRGHWEKAKKAAPKPVAAPAPVAAATTAAPATTTAK